MKQFPQFPKTKPGHKPTKNTADYCSRLTVKARRQDTFEQRVTIAQEMERVTFGRARATN
jgi:hypothetical protein